jgi:HEAT repeat protein
MRALLGLTRRPGSGRVRSRLLGLWPVAALLAVLLVQLTASTGSRTRHGDTARAARPPGPVAAPAPAPEPVPAVSAGRTPLAAAPVFDHADPDAPGSTAVPALGVTPAPGLAANRERAGRAERLGRDRDDDTRLAAAREILASEVPEMLALRALEVLAELDPHGAGDELRRLAGRVGEDPLGQALIGSAIQSLGRSAELLTANDLELLFEGGSREVRIAAAAALAARGDESLSLRMQRQRVVELSHEDPGVRAAAVRDLGSLNSRNTLEPLLPMLADESGEVRLATLVAVQNSGDSSALERVRPLLDDPDEAVRRAAVRVVEAMERGLERRTARGRLGELATRSGPNGWR